MIRTAASVLALLAFASSTHAETLKVPAGPDAQERLQQALLDAKPGDTVEIGAGRFDLTDGLSLDVDKVTVTYEHPLKLIYDLRRMGETSVLADRHPHKLTRPLIARTAELYAERFGAPDGRIPATFEIITLTGWTARG